MGEDILTICKSDGGMYRAKSGRRTARAEELEVAGHRVEARDLFMVVRHESLSVSDGVMRVEVS